MGEEIFCPFLDLKEEMCANFLNRSFLFPPRAVRPDMVFKATTGNSIPGGAQKRYSGSDRK